MINQNISDIFEKMAAYCEMSSDKNAFFRARAFKKAAEVVNNLSFDLAEPEWHDLEKLKSLEGVGERIAKHILDYIETEEIPEYEEMKKESPVKLEELMHIQGVGPKTILKLYKELGVTDLASLEEAARSNKIASLEGFGEKKQQNIIESLEFAIRNKDRIPLYIAENHIAAILKYMKEDKNLINVEAVGSYRRRNETVGDIDLLASSKDSEKTSAHFVNYSQTEKILGNGETKSSIWLKSKIQADLRIIPDEVFGSALQYFTGNKDHNVKLRQIAIDKGMKLSEYGVFDRKSEKLLASKTEKEVYEVVVSNYIDPLLRENAGEVEAAVSGTLPKLISEKDIIGDYHLHSVNSDGKNTIEEVALFAKKLGYKEIGISDHFGKLRIANAITPDEFDDYLKQIRDADQKIKGIKIYASAEVEIDKEGNLDFDADLLKQLDYIIASAHFSNKMPRDEMTKRLIKAIKNPLTTIMAHPTGRLINQRPGFEFDYAEVFKAAKENNVAMEINAHPMRLDLKWDLAKLAHEFGCKIAINTDSHAVEEMYNMRFGLDMAKKSWMTARSLWRPN